MEAYAFSCKSCKLAIVVLGDSQYHDELYYNVCRVEVLDEVEVEVEVDWSLGSLVGWTLLEGGELIARKVVRSVWKFCWSFEVCVVGFVLL
jgi:hypothetical protein